MRPLSPEESHEYLVLCWAKSASELSPQLHEIILTLDSLQWQRAFWMRCPISQLFSVNYQPTTCQTLTIKMSATKISPSQKGAMKSAEWRDEACETALLLLWTVSFLRPYRKASAGYCFLIRVASKSHHVDTPTHLKLSFSITSPLRPECLMYESSPP